MITNEQLRRLREIVGDLSPDHPVIASHMTLQRAVSAQVTGSVSIEVVAAIAAETARGLAGFEPLWIVVEQVNDAWDYRDTQLARELLDRDREGVADAEYQLLTAAGVRPEIAALIINAAFLWSAEPGDHQGRINPNEARAALRNTADDLENASREAEIRDIQEEADERSRDRRLRYKLKRIARIVHVGGGAVLLLVDIGATGAAAVANPLAGLGAGAVAVVSIGKGKDLIKAGISPTFGDD
jgi:hypothetical protein